MQSPWFILELQCYDPSALAPAPFGQNGQSGLFYLLFSVCLLSQGNQCLSLPCLLRKWTVGNAALSMFSSPLCSLAQLLILLSVSDKQTLKNIHRLPLCLPACLPDLCSWATPFLCRLHFHPCLFETHWDRRCALKLQEEK